MAASPILSRGSVVMLCALALLAIGVVMVNSAQMSIDPIDAGDTAWPTLGAAAPGARPAVPPLLGTREAAYAAVAIGVMLVVSRVRPRYLDAPAGWRPSRRTAIVVAASLALAALLAAVYVPGLEKPANGAHRWVRAPVIGQFQPSEVAKWALLGVLAWAAGAPGGGPARLRAAALPLAIVAALSAAIVLEDLGTGVLIAAAGTMVLIAAGLRLWLVMLAGAAATPLLALSVLTSDYRVDRVVTFIDPFTAPRGDGYHLIQSLATIAGGGPYGRGLGAGLQKFGYLPEDRTDFLFAVVCEELGIAGALLLCFLFGLLFAAVASVARAASSTPQRLFAFGVLVTLAGQTLMNLFVVTGLGPTKGIALPLVSAGGTGWVLTAAALGAVVAIDRASRAAAA